MNVGSAIKPILGHLAWLAKNIDTPANSGRAYDAALLTYNAAAILQWRFVFPVSDLDTSQNGEYRLKIMRLIKALVKTSRELVEDAKDTVGDDVPLRRRLARAIRTVVSRIPALLPTVSPTPQLMPELQLAPDVVRLLDEFLDAHHDRYREAVARGRAAARTERTGQAAAIQEAVAWLAYSHSSGYATARTREEHGVLAQLAAGYLKTAVEMPLDGDVLAAETRSLRDLAQSLAGQVAVEGNS
jgi:hypothetical protein